MQSALGFCFVFLFLLLDMAPKPSEKFKTRAKRNPGSSSLSGFAVGVRVLIKKCEETYETLTNIGQFVVKGR